MSVSQGTKIFGIQLGIDPKILVGGLLMLSALLFWFNSRGDDTPTSKPSESRPEAAPTALVTAPRDRSRIVRRNRSVANDRSILRIRAVDPTRGDIDPTLHLELLSRLQSVSETKPGRSLFEIGPEPDLSTSGSSAPVPKGPVIPVLSPQQAADAAQQGAPQVNIPLKFYGFVRPAEQGLTNSGLFLEGDNVLVASEGELIDHRYLVRELNAFSARLEDTQMKQGQTLPVVPEARPQ